MLRPTSSSPHVFTRWKGDLWVGVRAAHERLGELSRDREYTVLPCASMAPVCVTLDDGRVLCDFGPEHDHD